VCAEAFIARNGYTDIEGADTLELVFELTDYVPSRQVLLRRRYATLEAKAYGICRSTGYHTYEIVFRDHPLTSGKGARAVSMDAAHTHLALQHREFNLDALDQSQHACRRLRGSDERGSEVDEATT